MLHYILALILLFGLPHLGASTAAYHHVTCTHGEGFISYGLVFPDRRYYACIKDCYTDDLQAFSEDHNYIRTYFPPSQTRALFTRLEEKYLTQEIDRLNRIRSVVEWPKSEMFFHITHYWKKKYTKYCLVYEDRSYYECRLDHETEDISAFYQDYGHERIPLTPEKASALFHFLKTKYWNKKATLCTED